MSRAFILLLTLVLGASRTVPAQQSGTVQGFQRQGSDNRLKLVLDFSALAARAQWFGNGTAQGNNLLHYKLFVVSAPNTSQMHVTDVSQAYIDRTGSPVACPRSFSCSSAQLLLDTFSKSVGIPLLTALHTESSYVIEVQDPVLGLLDASISTAPAVISYDEALLRNSVKITASVNLAVSYSQPIKVFRTYVVGPTASTDNYNATVARIDPDGVVLHLDRNLPAGKGKPMQLSVVGITDTYGTAVSIKSKVSSFRRLRQI